MRLHSSSLRRPVGKKRDAEGKREGRIGAISLGGEAAIVYWLEKHCEERRRRRWDL